MKQIEGTDSIFKIMDKGLFRDLLPSTPILDIDPLLWGYWTMGYMIMEDKLIDIPIWYGYKR
jgi:hypothetical protein